MLRSYKRWLAVPRLSRVGRLVAGIAACALLGQISSAAGQTATPSERRLALVVGNANYANIGKLPNAETDAHAVAKELATHGFEVMEGYNLDRRALLDIVSRFADRLPDINVAAFYFAGQGAQQRGRNFILPTGIKPENQDDLASSAVPITSIAIRMMSMNRQAFDLLVIDASRDYPFQATGSGLRPPGLAAPEAGGVMVLQAAGANQVALDKLGPDDQDPNGVFTRELLRAMREPGVPIREMTTRLRNAVQRDAAAIGREQSPVVFDEATGDFAFTPGPKPSTAAPPAGTDASASVTTKPEPPKPDPPPGPEERKRILAQLHQLGFYDGVPTGEFGTSARSAIKQFQAFEGDPETGTLTVAEHDALARQTAALAAILAVPDHSPRAVAASTIPRAEDRRRRAWKLENPSGNQSADLAEAEYWYALAGAQGNRLALLALGNMKIGGKGTTSPDPAAAQLLWRAAAARGEPSAYYNLGTLAERGDGGQPDRAAALRWYRRAASLHFAEASQSLKRLEQ